MKAAIVIKERRTDYTTDTKMQTSYLPYALLGLFSGGITYLEVNLGAIWNLVVSLFVAGLASLAGAGGKYFFDRVCKPWLDRKFKKRKK